MSEPISQTQIGIDDHTGDTLVLEDTVAPWFHSAPVEGDQRRSYRYPAQTGRETATLHHGKNTWQAVLCEESAGGMAVVVEGKFNLQVNDELEVGIYTGWYRTRIVHVQPLEADQKKIGLKRISVISTAGDRQHASRRPSAHNSGNIRNLIAVAFVAMAVGVGATSFLGGSFKPKESKLRGGIPAHFADAPPNQQMKGMLEGVNLLMEPEVAGGLRLTRAQQESIEGMMVGASNSLSKTYEETRDQPPHVWYTQSQAVVNKALENILCSLTDEQVLQWRELMIRRQAFEKRNG